MVLQNCKLTYFGLPGRGESIRLALAIGNVTFEDERIEFKDWKELKPKTPFGSIPMLTLSDGTVIAQQRAILRMVGKETGLYPSDDVVAAAKADEIMDATEDIISLAMKAGQALEGEEKAAARKAACEKDGALYDHVEKIDAWIGTNEGALAVGENLTVADLFIYCISSSMVSGMFDGIPGDTFDKFKNVTALRKEVRSHPGVCKWYDDLDPNIKMPASFGVI